MGEGRRVIIIHRLGSNSLLVNKSNFQFGKGGGLGGGVGNVIFPVPCSISIEQLSLCPTHSNDKSISSMS